MVGRVRPTPVQQPAFSTETAMYANSDTAPPGSWSRLVPGLQHRYDSSSFSWVCSQSLSRTGVHAQPATVCPKNNEEGM